MNCRGVSRRLSAYIDNDLSPGVRQSVEEHLRACRSCARRLAELEAIIASARGMPPLEVPAGLKERVMAAIRWRPKPVLVLSGIRLRLVLGGAAFATAAVMVLLFAGPRSSTETAGPGQYGTESGPGLAEQLDSAAAVDFTEDPRVKIKSFPVPEGADRLIPHGEDSLLLADSASRVDEFVLPVIDKTKENVNVKF